ncbi:50S ribosomal protein L23 [Candidatus Saccharibacteria bacterium]|nr:MAG: 50S ribosomal protein L23 [Candidatus Saccharibacteria bacterium]
MSAHISLVPRMSEKAYAATQQNTYVFTVPTTANKQQIASAVAEQYGVKVTDVRAVIVKGKPVRASRGKRAYPATAYRSNIKKAYVTVAEGDSIKIFDEEEK